MVDYNNETTVTVAPANIVKISILQLWHDALNAKEEYSVNRYKGIAKSDAYIRARISTLMTYIYGSLNRENDKTWIDNIYSALDKTIITYEEWNDIFNAISKYLDTKRLTRFDVKKEYDTSRAEVENREMGI